MAIVTLTTDFGLRDWFVGVMKGVLLGINPDCRIVDLTHDIPPGDIRAAAFALRAGFRYFPAGSIHLVVVDPGVGSRRPAIVLHTRDCAFVGPDNGVISLAIMDEPVLSVHRITNRGLFLHPVSRTFHGRDVFAPVAARLSQGMPPSKVGPRTRSFERLSWPRIRRRGKIIQGEIVHFDRFGNAITNIPGRIATGTSGAATEVWVQGRRLCPVATHYQAAAIGMPLGVVGSCDLLEIAVNGGSARKLYSLALDEEIELRPQGRARRG